MPVGSAERFGTAAPLDDVQGPRLLLDGRGDAGVEVGDPAVGVAGAEHPLQRVGCLPGADCTSSREPWRSSVIDEVGRRARQPVARVLEAAGELAVAVIGPAQEEVGPHIVGHEALRLGAVLLDQGLEAGTLDGAGEADVVGRLLRHERHRLAETREGGLELPALQKRFAARRPHDGREPGRRRAPAVAAGDAAVDFSCSNRVRVPGALPSPGANP